MRNAHANYKTFNDFLIHMYYTKTDSKPANIINNVLYALRDV